MSSLPTSVSLFSVVLFFLISIDDNPLFYYSATIADKYFIFSLIAELVSMCVFEHHFLCLNSHLYLKLISDRCKSEYSQSVDDPTVLAVLSVVIMGQFCRLNSLVL